MALSLASLSSTKLNAKTSVAWEAARMQPMIGATSASLAPPEYWSVNAQAKPADSAVTTASKPVVHLAQAASVTKASHLFMGMAGLMLMMMRAGHVLRHQRTWQPWKSLGRDKA